MLSRFFINLSLVFVLAVLTGGCNVQFVNTPTDDAVVEDLELIGDFKIEQGPAPFQVNKGIVSIRRSGDKQFPYLIEYDLEKLPKDKLLCQTYRFGDTIIAFVKYSKKGPTRYYFAFRLEVSEHQIEAKTIAPSFFTDNPAELPINRKADDQLLIDSESATLDLFFETNQDSKSLFDQETPLKLIRTNKDSD